MSPYNATLIGAKLPGTLGVILLGIGVGEWLGRPLTGYVVPVLIVGGVCPASGMGARLGAPSGAIQLRW